MNQSMNPIMISNPQHGKEINRLKAQISSLEDELYFYKSIFLTHSGSVIFNLRIKYSRGKNVWVDAVRCDKKDLLELDRDEEIDEWLRPIRYSR